MAIIIDHGDGTSITLDDPVSPSRRSSSSSYSWSDPSSDWYQDYLRGRQQAYQRNPNPYRNEREAIEAINMALSALGQFGGQPGPRQWGDYNYRVMPPNVTPREYGPRMSATQPFNYARDSADYYRYYDDVAARRPAPYENRRPYGQAPRMQGDRPVLPAAQPYNYAYDRDAPQERRRPPLQRGGPRMKPPRTTRSGRRPT